MYITNIKEAPIKENPHNADVRLLQASENLLSLHLHLKPQEQLTPVKTETEAVFFILEGNPEILIENETHIAEPNSLIHCPANSIHCINNPSDTEARIFIVKKP